MITRESKPRPAATTIASAILIFAVTAFWLFAGGLVLMAAFFRDPEDAPVLGGELTSSARGLLVFIGVLIVGFCVATILSGVGILRRKVWARWTGVGLFSTFALIALFGMARTLGDQGVAAEFPFLVANTLIVVLLLLPATARDFYIPPPTSGPATPSS